MAKNNIIASTQERGLAVTPQEAATFPYDAIDIMIAQNMLAGISTAQGLSEVIPGTKEVTIRHRLLDPVRCAWLSQQLSNAISTRLGQVLTAVYGRAVTTGDPRAAELLLRQYGALITPTQRHEHLELKADLSKLPADILEKMIREKMRDLGLKETQEAQVEEIKNAPE